MNGLQASLARSPELFPHSLDPRTDRISFVHLNQSDYERASFLDARILAPHTLTHELPWPQVAAALDAAELAERCNFIFHIGHVGSTLLSRLVGAHRGVFSLREPLLLRTFSQVQCDPSGAPHWKGDDFEARLTGALKLLSRTFDAGVLPVVKATSFVSELSASLLARPAAPQAILMFVTPQSYLATILGGPASREEAKVLTPNRLRRLHRRIGTDAWRAEHLSEGECLALGWACEMSALAAAHRAAGARAYLVDFDEFLADPSALVRILRHLRMDATAAEVDAILSGPDMRRYSKAPEFAYDAALRHAVLSEARAMHAAEIRRGLIWLEEAAARFSPVRDALEMIH